MNEKDLISVPVKKRIKNWVKFSLLPPLGALVIRGIKASMRLEQRGYEPVDALYREKRSIIQIGRAHV